MQDLYVFYGNGLVQARPDGLDLSRYQCKVVRAEGLDAMNIHELRSCIQREFVTEATTKKVVIEGITCTNVVWELVKVNGSIAWCQYMQIASQPEAAIHGRPMVYANFVRRPPGNLDDAGASGSGQPQAELEDSSTESAVLEEVHERRVAHNFVQEGAGLWWSTRIDWHEYLPNQPLGLESDEDADPSSDGSDDDAHQAGGPTGGIVSSELPYVASRLDDIECGRSYYRKKKGPSGGLMLTPS